MISGFPNPQTDPQFYQSVRWRRVAAWIIDVVLVMLVGFFFTVVGMG